MKLFETGNRSSSLGDGNTWPRTMSGNCSNSRSGGAICTGGTGIGPGGGPGGGGGGPEATCGAAPIGSPPSGAEPSSTSCLRQRDVEIEIGVKPVLPGLLLKLVVPDRYVTVDGRPVSITAAKITGERKIRHLLLLAPLPAVDHKTRLTERRPGSQRISDRPHR